MENIDKMQQEYQKLVEDLYNLTREKSNGAVILSLTFALGKALFEAEVPFETAANNTVEALAQLYGFEDEATIQTVSNLAH